MNDLTPKFTQSKIQTPILNKIAEQYSHVLPSILLSKLQKYHKICQFKIIEELEKTLCESYKENVLEYNDKICQ